LEVAGDVLGLQIFARAGYSSTPNITTYSYVVGVYVAIRSFVAKALMAWFP
jgi:hypothetical protein